MTIFLVGGEHSKSVSDWEDKLPDKEFDKIAVERISRGTTDILDIKILRALYQPLSALSLVILNLPRFIIHNIFEIGLRQNEYKVAKKISEKEDVELLKIDAPALEQIKSFELWNEKALIDWFSIYVILQSTKLPLTTLLYLVMTIFSIQFLATLWMYKDIRDRFMTEKIKENYGEDENFLVLTGTLHSPAIAGYLKSKGLDEIEVSGTIDLPD